MRFSFMRNSVLLASFFGLMACENQTTVQRDYVSHRDQCQYYAEGNIDRFSEPGQAVDMRARNAKLVTLFSDCMFEMGWTVATPNREDDVDGEQQVADVGDDLPQLNDVQAGAQALEASKASPPAAASTAIPLDPNRRAPAEQHSPQ